MKRVFKFIFCFLIMLTIVGKTQAMTFEEAFMQSNRKPMVVLIYAKWVDDLNKTQEQYRQLPPYLGKIYNFTELDIASEDAKFFNEKFQIYPKLPYILMFREGGKISRYIERDCAKSATCTASKLKSFLQ